MAVQLEVILEEHDIWKLTLSTGILNTVEDLVSVVGETFQLHGEFGLLYKDKDFGFWKPISQLLTYMTTVKVIRKETVITLDLHPADTSGLSSTLSCLRSLDTHPASNSELDTYPADDDASSPVSDCASSSSKDTIILPDSCHSAPWPVPFQVPQFSCDIELILAEANKSYHATRIHFVEKFPCLKEPGSLAGLYGWQQRIKNKMHNYRAKLKSRKYAYPEIEVN